MIWQNTEMKRQKSSWNKKKGDEIKTEWKKCSGRIYTAEILKEKYIIINEILSPRMQREKIKKWERGEDIWKQKEAIWQHG